MVVSSKRRWAAFSTYGIEQWGSEFIELAGVFGRHVVDEVSPNQAEDVDVCPHPGNGMRYVTSVEHVGPTAATRCHREDHAPLGQFVDIDCAVVGQASTVTRFITHTVRIFARWSNSAYVGSYNNVQNIILVGMHRSRTGVVQPCGPRCRRVQDCISTSGIAPQKGVDPSGFRLNHVLFQRITTLNVSLQR